MPCQQVLWILGLCLLGPGCAPILYYAGRNVGQGKCDNWGEWAARIRDHRLAEAVWSEVRQAEPCAASEHYADGFKEGFVDYLDAGGDCQPPVAPPWRLRKPKYETPEGQQAVQDWFAGFRDGAQTAAASGYRSLVIVPVTGTIHEMAPATSPADSPPTGVADPSPVLPPPRPLAPDPDRWLPTPPPAMKPPPPETKLMPAAAETKPAGPCGANRFLLR